LLRLPNEFPGHRELDQRRFLACPFRLQLLSSLADAGVANALFDPTLNLVDGGGTIVATNDNWRDPKEPAIIDSPVPPNDDCESAADVQLIHGKNNTTGNALVEIAKLSWTS
jgi:hypothetical protein